MKRILALLLAAVMCLSLVACGSESTANGNSNAPKDESGANTEEEQKFSYIVHIKVNPEIELICDETGCIHSLVCLNKDAKKATQGLSVDGKPLDEGLTELLLAFHQAGYIKKDSNMVSITINCYTNPDDSAFQDMCTAAMQDFASITNIGLQCAMNANYYGPTEPPINDQSQSGQQQDSNTTETTDTEGNRVVTVRDDNGDIKQEIVYSPSGTLIRQTDYADDGAVVTTEFNANGTPAREYTVWTEGASIEVQYNTNGQRIESKEVDSDGNSETLKYHANGTISERTQVTESQTRVVCYYEDGTKKSVSEVDTNGRNILEEYSAAGILLYRKEAGSDSSLKESWYYDSGVDKEFISTQTDLFIHQKYYENGNMSYKYSQEVSTLDYEEIFYDVDGNMTERKWKETYQTEYVVCAWHGDTGIADGYAYRNDGTVWYILEYNDGAGTSLWNVIYQVS